MESSNQGTSYNIKRKVLFNVWRSEKSFRERKAAVLNFVLDNLNLHNCAKSTKDNINKMVSTFCKYLGDRWRKCHRVVGRFEAAEKNWLESEISFKDCVRSSKQPGRPLKSFGECSHKSQIRKVEPLVKGASTEELSLATQLSLRSKGMRDAAKILKEVSQKSPTRATTMKKNLKSPNQRLPVKLSLENALAMYIDNQLTKRQYINIRKTAKLQNANIFPSYDKLLTAKKMCYPANIIITDISAEINLQSLLDHTVNRIVLSQYDIFKELSDMCNVNIIYKWGCDGASGQSNYKQFFGTDHDGEEKLDDSFLFVTSLVPMEMKSLDKIVWKNPRPSSTRYCRPIKLIFKKETAEFIRQEVNEINENIKKLSRTEIKINEKTLLVHHQLIMTMIDGKICNALTEVSSQRCYICGCTPTQMNDLENHKNRIINTSAMAFGLSTLHALIRCFEYILHISYRLETKTWSIKKQDKEKVDSRKKSIQDRFRAEMGLLVDVPKQGSGNTNDGNTARRFFKNCKLAADITGVKEKLIFRFSVILQTITCGYEIDTAAFAKYSFETAQMCVQDYGWYYMPPSVHKILIHGSDIIFAALLPIGQLSEEAQEARNKDCRRYREYHSRKFSRKANMEDLLHMLLISSDPLITSKSNFGIKKPSKLRSS